MPSGILDILHQTENTSILNDKPEITFFRTIFFRHTPFSTEYIIEPASGNTDFSSTLSKSGDLVHRIVLRAEISPVFLTTPEDKAKNWYLLPHVLPTFTRIIPLPSNSSILKTYRKIISVLGIKNLLTGNISETQTYTSIESIEELMNWFGNTLTYRAFLFLDFLELITYITTKYKNGLTIERETMEAFKNHLLHDIIFLDGTTSYLLEHKPPELLPHLIPFLFDSYSLEIGGTMVNEYSPYFYSSLYKVKDSGSIPEYNNLLTPTYTNEGTLIVHIPLLFFFCESSAVALPICAMRYHDVRIGATATQSPFITKKWRIEHVDFITEYIHLSDRERLKFTTSTMEYLIHQVQEQSITIPRGITEVTEELVFSRPCIELLWYPIIYTNQEADFTTVKDMLTKCEIILGGDVIGTEKDARFYRLITAYESHSRVEAQSPIYGYSFALDAEDYEPSGSLNIGRIPHTYLKLSLNSTIWDDDPYQVTIFIFSRCYNVLRISNGMTDLAFS